MVALFVMPYAVYVYVNFLKIFKEIKLKISKICLGTRWPLDVGYVLIGRKLIYIF